MGGIAGDFFFSGSDSIRITERPGNRRLF